MIDDHDCAECYKRSIEFRSKLNTELKLTNWALNQIKSVNMFLDSCEETLDYLEIEVTPINLSEVLKEFNDDLVDETFNEETKESNYVEVEQNVDIRSIHELKRPENNFFIIFGALIIINNEMMNELL